MVLSATEDHEFQPDHLSTGVNYITSFKPNLPAIVARGGKEGLLSILFTSFTTRQGFFKQGFL